MMKCFHVETEQVGPGEKKGAAGRGRSGSPSGVAPTLRAAREKKNTPSYCTGAKGRGFFSARKKRSDILEFSKRVDAEFPTL